MATDITTEAATESADDLAKRFERLAATWREETRHLSRIDLAQKHPAFREVVAMGERAVPLILADMEKNGGQWFEALSAITAADPIPDEIAGDIEKMEAAWFAWARTKGYRWEHAV